MKQRIVGALVLIALGAIIIPIVLDLRGDKTALEKSVGIPPKPDDFNVEVLPLVHPDKESTRKAPGPAAEPEPAMPAGIAEPAQSEQDSPASKSPSGSDTPETQSTPSSDRQEATSGGEAGNPKAWAVQVGSFADQDNALGLRDKLVTEGYQAYIEEVKIDSGQSRYRVRVGPELLRSEAEDLQHQIQDEMKLSGIVVSH